MTELMLEGVVCQRCGSYIDGEAPGYPRACDGCADDEVANEIKTYYGGTNPLD